MVTRTYIDKNNTIIFGTLINTGRNPIAELYYGEKKLKLITPDTYYILIFQIYNKNIIMVN
jgi:hypothetical protein